MKRRVSHIPRTLDWLRKSGYIAQKVEHRKPYQGSTRSKPCASCGSRGGDVQFGKTVDLFGFVDIVALPLDSPASAGSTLYVQVCAESGLAPHQAKALASQELGLDPLAGTLIEIPALDVLLRAGNGFIIVAYGNRAKATQCASCQGAGSTLCGTCRSCKGKGYVDGRARWHRRQRIYRRTRAGAIECSYQDDPDAAPGQLAEKLRELRF